MRLSGATLLLALLIAPPAVVGASDVLPRVLVYQRNGVGYVHDNLGASAEAIRRLGATNRFEVDVLTNAAVFTEATLARYQAVVFANTNNEAFDDEAQRDALRRWLEAGGGFVGIHSSTGSERRSEWFRSLQGGRFLRHSPLQRFVVRVVDADHPATSHFDTTWTWTDECYFFTGLEPGLRILLAAETGSLADPGLAASPGDRLRGLAPLAWCIEGSGGRRFYTSLGHRIAHYTEPAYLRHLLGGIQWVLAGASRTEPASP